MLEQTADTRVDDYWVSLDTRNHHVGGSLCPQRSPVDYEGPDNPPMEQNQSLERWTRVGQ